MSLRVATPLPATALAAHPASPVAGLDTSGIRPDIIVEG